MQFLKLGSKVKFRANEAQDFEHGTIVGHAFMHPGHPRCYPVYLIETLEGYYHQRPGSSTPFYVNAMVVSCDCVELDS